MCTSKYLWALALPLLSTTAMADSSGLRDLTVEQTAAAEIVAPHPGALSTSIVVDRANATYAVGETVRLTLATKQNAYVTVLDIGPTGTVTQLFPNRFQADNRLRAGQPVEIAGPGTGARISVGEPTGTELIKVISSNKPFAVIPERQLAGAGPFRVVVGGVKSAMRDLNVMANAPASNDTLIALSNYALYTTPARNGGNGETVVVIPGQPAAAAPVLHVDVPAHQPFPLLMAADRTKYKIGDRPAIAVTTLRACNLTVLEFNAAGVARTLYPSAASPNPAVGAQQTVFVGGVAGADLKLAGPAGLEQVLAICTASGAAAVAGAPLPPAKADGSTNVVTVQKNLVVVASDPGTAMASVTFAVHP